MKVFGAFGVLLGLTLIFIGINNDDETSKDQEKTTQSGAEVCLTLGGVYTQFADGGFECRIKGDGK